MKQCYKCNASLQDKNSKPFLMATDRKNPGIVFFCVSCVNSLEKLIKEWLSDAARNSGEGKSS